MNKKLLAVAVAGVFAAPAAFAQSSNVVLYGRLNMGVDNASATGATNNTATVSNDFKSRMRQFDSGSRLGVRGTEDLGNGLRAVFQIESGLNANNGQNTALGGQQNFSTGYLASRPSWVGLEGGWGSVKAGKQDVYWGNGTINQTGPNYVNADLPWVTGGAGRVSAGVTRQNNVVSYQSPTVAGLNAQLSWSPDTNSGGNTGIVIASATAGNNGAAGYNNSENVGTGKNANAQLLGLTVRGAWGPLQTQYDFVVKKGTTDQSAAAGPVGVGIANIAPETFANKLGIGFAYMPGGMINVIGTAIHVKDVGITSAAEAQAGTTMVTGTTENLNQTTVGITWEQLVGGNILLLAQIGEMQKVKGCSVGNQANICDNSGAKGYMLGVRYNLSKRTAIYTAFNRVNNDKNQFADYAGGAQQVGPLGAAQKGADPQIISVGMQHNF